MSERAVLDEMREQTAEELERRAVRLRSELFKFRMQRQTNQLENPMRPRRTRRELARVLTILRARGFGRDPSGRDVETAAAPSPDEAPAKKPRRATARKKATGRSRGGAEPGRRASAARSGGAQKSTSARGSRAGVKGKRS